VRLARILLVALVTAVCDGLFTHYMQSTPRSSPPPPVLAPARVGAITSRRVSAAPGLHIVNTVRVKERPDAASGCR
jgi:hypothetical protein